MILVFSSDLKLQKLSIIAGLFLLHYTHLLGQKCAQLAINNNNCLPGNNLALLLGMLNSAVTQKLCGLVPGIHNSLLPLPSLT